MNITALEQNVNQNYTASVATKPANNIVKAKNIQSVENENTSLNTDNFALSERSAENAGIYSPKALAKSSAVGYAGTTTAKKIENIPYSLAAKRAGLSVDSDGMPRINGSSDYNQFNAEMNKIRNVNKKISCKAEYRYSQTGNSYGYTNATTSCATYALATAVSIREGKAITPKDIVTESSTSGHGTSWSSHDAYKVENCSEQNVLLAVDAQLSLGNPVLIHATDSYGSGHWATVIGKDSNGEYTIIDPYYGEECKLSEMQIYKNQGGKLDQYVVVSNKY